MTAGPTGVIRVDFAETSADTPRGGRPDFLSLSLTGIAYGQTADCAAGDAPPPYVTSCGDACSLAGDVWKCDLAAFCGANSAFSWTVANYNGAATDYSSWATCGGMGFCCVHNEQVGSPVNENSGCAAMPDGSLQCFGSAISWGGPAPDVPLVDVATGRNHACGREADGTVHCWGRDGFGDPYPAPPAGSWAAIEAYQLVTCVYDGLGEHVCWWPTEGAPPYAVPDEPLVQFGLGEWDACGVTVDGRALCWGEESGLGETFPPQLNP